jgi:hypothetical protein
VGLPRDAEETVPHTGGMEIVVNIHEGKDGGPVGTVRAAGSPEARSFSGNLEFLALVESLYLPSDRSTTTRQKSPTKGSEDV